MTRALLVVAVAIAALGAVLVTRTMRVPAPIAAATDGGAAIALDEAAAAERLAGAIRFPTISYASGAPIDTAAFLGLHQYLAETFPLVH